MGKAKSPRRVADNEAMAVSRMLRTSPQKLNLVAQMIRGKKGRKGAVRADVQQKAHFRRCSENAAIRDCKCGKQPRAGR